MPPRTLILGGARSGKSRHAQQAVAASGLPVTLIVTARADTDDGEMRARIARHRADRPANWRVVEAPDALPAAIEEHCQQGRATLVDCVTLWLANLLCEQPDQLAAACAALHVAVEQARGPLCLVSNEVGWSIVPEHPLGRQFRDEQGRLNQQLAAICDQVTLVAAGLPLRLK